MDSQNAFYAVKKAVAQLLGRLCKAAYAVDQRVAYALYDALTDLSPVDLRKGFEDRLYYVGNRCDQIRDSLEQTDDQFRHKLDAAFYELRSIVGNKLHDLVDQCVYTAVKELSKCIRKRNQYIPDGREKIVKQEGHRTVY